MRTTRGPQLKGSRAGRPWKVGVLGRRNHGLWRLRVLHKEMLPTGQDPKPRRDELVQRVKARAFDQA